MIVRPGHGFIHLITQPDHAALARRIMEHWLPLGDHPRRASILLAIAEHDNGWQEPDDHPTMDEAGRVVDFVTAPLSIRHDVWPRGVARLADDPWAAALVAHHAVYVYDRFRPNPEWAIFFAQMEASRDALVSAAGRPLATLLEDYVFVRMGDLISLTFCTGWTDEQRHDQWRVVQRDGRVTVTPDPFGGRANPIAIEARQLPAEPFASEKAFRAAFGAAPRVTLSGVVG